MQELTQSFIIDKSQLLPILLYKENLISKIDSPYFLLIYSTIPTSTKISVYPIPVMKIIIKGPAIIENTIEKLIDLLSALHPIMLHTSGIIYDKVNYIYELYFIGIEDNFTLDIRLKIKQISGIKDWEFKSLFPGN